MKFKQKKSSKSFISDKIADALTLKPKADIEDDHVFNTKPNIVSRADYTSDSEDETAISDFRKRNVNLLSEISKKYEGTVVSRKELEDNSESSQNPSGEESSEEDSPYKLKRALSNDYKNIKNSKLIDKSSEDVFENSLEAFSNKGVRNKLSNELLGKLKQTPSDDSDYSDESDDYNILQNKTQSKSTSDESANSEDGFDSDAEEEGEGYDISQMEEPAKEKFEHVKKQNLSEEAKKGACVRSELLIWESLLEMRIHLQRCMNTANMMPLSDRYWDLRSMKQFEEDSNVTINNVADVLDKFLTLQNLLMKNFPETKSLSKNQTQSIPKTKEEIEEEIPSDTDNEEIPSDTDAEHDTALEVNKTVKIDTKKPGPRKRKLEDYESDISTRHKSLKTFRDSTIQKWNEKTRLATAANIKNAPTNTILQQISYILSDRNKLIRRTQLKRSDYDIIGYKKSVLPDNEPKTDLNPTIKDRKVNDEYIPEIFDDSDFYHQLLRELIECKSADISDPVQLSRQWIALQQMRSKMKRKVDTRATKGRKIKYVVHNQLVSYMAPEKSLKWNDESTNELYNSLFGKMFEHNNVGINVEQENIRIKE